RLNAILLQIFNATLHAVFFLGWIGARGAKDRASLRQNSFHCLQVERTRDVFQDAAPAFHKADELVLMMKNALANNSSNYSVQPRTIAASGKNANLHFLPHLLWSLIL